MIGMRIGKYLITEELGRGGMGIVYKATQVTLNRTVAMKVLFPHLAKSGEYLGRFRREAVTLAKVQHENIVHIYDVEEFEGVSCIVMEYVGGPSLTKVLAREQRLDAARACDISAALASALDAAHKQGIIHRDIKPDNILFSADGRPKLTDFGIAHMRDDSVHTRTGIMLGTPYYMSPEQARGKQVTAASDLYSLGVVLFEALSGQVPFMAEDSLAVALKHVQEAPPALSSLAPSVPPALCELVHRMLEKDPARRFPNARDFLVALRSVSLAGGGTATPVPSSTSHCPECSAQIRDDFLTCPRCALAIRQQCGECSRLYDPVSPECPFCRTPSTPTPAPAIAVGDRDIDLSASGRMAGVTEAGATSAGPAVAGAGVAARSADAGDRAGVAAKAAMLIDGVGAALDKLPPPPTATAIRRVLGSVYSRLAAPRLAGLPAAIWIGIVLLAVALLAAMSIAAIKNDDGSTTAVVENSSSSGAGVSTFVPPPPANQPATRTRQQREMTPAERERAGQVLTSLLPQDSSNAHVAVDSAQQDQGDVVEDTPPADTKVSAPADETRTAEDAEAAARSAISAIVERQRVATEKGDLEMLLRDVSPELHDAVRESFDDMQQSTREVTSRIRDIEIDFDDGAHAVVTFRVELRGVRASDGRRVMLFNGTVEWLVERSGGRWLIAAIG